MFYDIFRIASVPIAVAISVIAINDEKHQGGFLYVLRAIITSVLLVSALCLFCYRDYYCSYPDGIIAAEKLESGSYATLEEAQGLVDQVESANEFLAAAKENSYPWWDGRRKEKYQDSAPITVSDEAKAKLRDYVVGCITTEFESQLECIAAELESQLTPPASSD